MNIWEEGVANHLLCNGIVQKSGPPPSTLLKHLALTADNCSEQNKDKMLMKFCVWLVESETIKKVTLY